MEKFSSNLQNKSAMRYTLAERRIQRTADMMKSNAESGEMFERQRNVMDVIVASRGEVRFPLYFPRQPLTIAL